MELAFLAPFIILLFLALFNWGFFMYAGESVANAARLAALELGRQNVPTGQGLACLSVRNELKFLPNASSFAANCNTAPLCVDVAGVSGACSGGIGGGVTAPHDNTKPSVQVRVVYDTPIFFPLPWLRGKWSLQRKANVFPYD